MPTRLELEASEQEHSIRSHLISEAIRETTTSNTFGLARLLQVHPELVLHVHSSRMHPEHSPHWNEGDTLLHLAARRGYSNGVEIMVEECGANVNVISGAPCFEQPLHLAAASGQDRIVDCLLRNGAQSSALNRQHMTPFMSACSAGSQRAALEILRKGLVVDVEIAATGGRTALWLACSTGLLEVVMALWAAGAVPCLDVDRRSLLHAACIGGHLPLVEFLVKNGIRLTADAHGKQPLDYLDSPAVVRRANLCLLEFQAAGAHSAWRLRQGRAKVEGAGDFNWFQRTVLYERVGGQLFAGLDFAGETEEQRASRVTRETRQQQQAAVAQAARACAEERELRQAESPPLFSIPWPPVIRKREPVARAVFQEAEDYRHHVA